MKHNSSKCEIYCLQNTNWQFAQWLTLIHLSHLAISLLCQLSTVLTCHPHKTGHAVLAKKNNNNNLKLIYLPQATKRYLALTGFSSAAAVFASGVAGRCGREEMILIYNLFLILILKL